MSAMKCLLDFGNTRFKWAIIDENDEQFDQVTFLSTGSEVYAQLSKCVESLLIDYLQIDSIWLASVQSDERLLEIQQFVVNINQRREQKRDLQQAQIQLHSLTVPKKRSGVTNAYQDFATLGVDRWLGLVAAHHFYEQAAMVVDAGTAITVDVITSEGVHQGGWILPGLSMMRQSLMQYTARLPLINEGHRGLGQSTSAAIGNGTFEAALALIEHQFGQFQVQHPEAALIITGGDGELLYNALTAEVQVEAGPVSMPSLILDPDWVLKGLWVESMQPNHDEMC